MTTQRAPFGTLLKHYRVAGALSQGALAAQAGLSLDAISALNNSHRNCFSRIRSAPHLRNLQLMLIQWEPTI
jgi:hypothetical protein